MDRPLDNAAQPPVPPPSRVPVPLLAALTVVGLEVAALVGSAVVFLVDAVRGVATDLTLAVALAVFFVGFALLLAAAGRALFRRRRWGRGPVVTLSLLQVVSGLALAGTSPAWLVVALVVAGVVGVLGVLWPSSRAYAYISNAPDTMA